MKAMYIYIYIYIYIYVSLDEDVADLSSELPPVQDGSFCQTSGGLPGPGFEHPQPRSISRPSAVGIISGTSIGEALAAGRRRLYYPLLCSETLGIGRFAAWPCVSHAQYHHACASCVFVPLHVSVAAAGPLSLRLEHR